MRRVNCILNNESYKRIVEELDVLEANRIFCRHNLEHFLNVARIAHIINLEEELNIEKELIYAAALLHDIGRLKEYKLGISHHAASAEMSKELLKECSFNEAESRIILDAINSHRGFSLENNNPLSILLYKSDKLSRNCFNCQFKKGCKWSEDKKNYIIQY